MLVSVCMIPHMSTIAFAGFVVIEDRFGLPGMVINHLLLGNLFFTFAHEKKFGFYRSINVGIDNQLFAFGRTCTYEAKSKKKQVMKFQNRGGSQFDSFSRVPKDRYLWNFKHSCIILSANAKIS